MTIITMLGLRISVSRAWVLSPLFFVVAEVELSHPPEDLAWVFSDLLVLS